MGSGVGHPDLALYRSVKSGETGLNLKLEDLVDRFIEVPSLCEILKTLVTREKITLRLKAYPAKLITKLHVIQTKVDDKVESEVRKAKVDL